MNDRQASILETIIREYIKTGVPVGSQVVVDSYHLGVSSATVRNEMAELEKLGLIIQPHTSAGRVPTEAAYKWYISKLSEQKIAPKEAKVLTERFQSEETDYKKLVKDLAELSGLAVFWANQGGEIYYNGIANLVSQPEFEDSELIYGLSEVIDSLDEILENYFEKVHDRPLVLIGSEGPFGNFCSSILIKYKIDGRTGMVGLLGPTRMDYGKNLSLLNYIYKRLI